MASQLCSSVSTQVRPLSSKKAIMVWAALAQVTCAGAAGVGMLIKLLSNGRNVTVPKPVISGPVKIDDTTWSMTYTFKYGVMKYGIKSQFTLSSDKIVMIQNTRV